MNWRLDGGESFEICIQCLNLCVCVCVRDVATYIHGCSTLLVCRQCG